MALCVTPDRSHNPLPVTRADKRIKCHDDGPVAEHIKLRHNHSHGEKTQWPSPYFFVWCCDNCGRQGGMTVKMNEQCPECQHYRCLNCDVEVVRTYPRDSCADSGTLTNGPLSSIYSPKLYAPGLQALMGGKRSDGHLGHSSPKILKILAKHSHQNRQQLESPITNGYINPSILGHTAGPNIASDSLLASSPLAQSSLSSVSSTRTLESPMSSGPFSCEEDQTESETELYSDDIESEHDDTDSEDEMEYQGGVISVLQSRLCIVLGHDLELAAHLIRQAHTQWRIGAVTEATVYTVAPSNEPIGAGESHGPVSAPSSIPGNSIFHDGSNQPKRERKRDESEDRRGNGSPKRRRIMSDGSHIRLPFACHFHKMDPIRYCRSKGEKFRGCLGLPPSVRDLRRIKGHFEAAHRRPQCQRCYAFFDNRDDLQDHRKAVPCIRNSDTLKEGIDDSQWDKIKNILKVKKQGMSSDEKKDYDYNNWFEIWKILFPDIPPPKDPWDGSMKFHSSAPPYNHESLLNIFNIFIDREIQHGTLPPEAGLICENALRLALKAQDVVFEPVQSVEPPLSDVKGPKNGYVEQDLVVPGAIRGVEKPPGEICAVESLQGSSSSVPLAGFQCTISSQQPEEILQEDPPQTLHISIESTSSDTLMDFTGTANAQPFPTVPSSPNDPEFSLPLPQVNEYPIPDLDQSQEFLGIFDHVDFPEPPLFDPLQDVVLAFDTDNFEIDTDHLNLDMSTWDSDFLTNGFALENEGVEATAKWKSKHDGNKGLPMPFDMDLPGNLQPSKRSRLQSFGAHTSSILE